MNLFRDMVSKATVWNRERYRWAAKADKSMPVVFYGHEAIVGKDRPVHGGAVKLQDLQAEFPNTPYGANLLYLVSSALPSYAPLMANFARHGGARVVLNQNGVCYPAWYGKDWKRANDPFRRLIETADHVVYQSRFCKKAADRFAAVCDAEWSVLHNPVDTSVFVHGPALPEEPLVLLLAGSHGFSYRVLTAVETLAALVLRGVSTAVNTR